ncbi:hypothetical protein [Sphingomonas sp. LaA6.9]|uniref:hypothetical protein n=1 Tax=Sphingomonas sp. LaA6.9 TaxID=2919914 RepID=UPI001F4F8D7C|nr:hypothetical protein [Sphingomonas sp. LaA6.9]MCJ8155899.1 hypothetical protein [Sphingomonas sp. LaA6.9]
MAASFVGAAGSNHGAGYGRPVPAELSAIGVRAFRRALLGAAATTTFLYLVLADAQAQCVPDNPPAGATVTCTGFDNDGYSASNAPITVEILQGATIAGTGLSIAGSGDVNIDNSGAIQGSSGTAVRIDGVAGFTKVFENHTGGSLNGNFLGSGDGRIVIQQNGNFNAGVTITGNGVNDLYLFASRGISGPVNITGSDNAIDNAGFFNNGLTLVATANNLIVNRAGAQLSGTFRVTGDGQNSIFNDGTINNGIAIVSNGEVFVANTGTISGNIEDTGSAQDFIDNTGTINNSILLHGGDDFVVNRSGVVNLLAPLSGPGIQGAIETGEGMDVLRMLDGVINGQVLMGSDADFATVSGGLISQAVQMQSGADLFFWNGGQIGALDMGIDDDVALFSQLAPSNMANFMPINGGLGDDRLYFGATRGEDVSRFTNWELFELDNGSTLTFSNFSTLTLGDSGTGTGELYIDETSTVFAGNGTHTVAPLPPASW